MGDLLAVVVARHQGVLERDPATGPLAVGLLHEATDGWTVGLVVLLCLLAVQLVVGLAAARPRLVRADA